ncbi:MAG: DegT/DnrJ/EryC1/StrS family aminotransferase [Planctomycetota bacterium]
MGSVRKDPRITRKLAVDGGPPVRKRPMPADWPGGLWYDREEVAAVTNVVRRRSPFRFYGPDVAGAVDAFEKGFARFVGCRYALAVNSGTGALMAALAAFGVGPGQEVIVPGYMWIATAGSVVRLGAIPVLAEVDDSFTMDPEDLARKITPRTTVVIPVHMRGAPSDMASILRVAREARGRGIRVLEDCAQASGGKFRGRPLGSWGDMGIYSFQLNKNMTTGEGGMLVAHDASLYERAWSFHDLGFPREGGRLSEKGGAILWGNGSRMTEMQGALGLVQLRKLPRIVAAMRRAKYRIRKGIADLPGVRLRRIHDEKGDTGPALITIHSSSDAAGRFAKALAAEGIHSMRVANEGKHLYREMTNLVKKLSISPDGFPWTHPANAAGRAYSYARGALPQTDALFDASVVTFLSSKLTEADVADTIVAYRKVALALGG